MIATTVGYDVLFVVHIVAALVTVVVVVGLRVNAGSAMSTSGDRNELRRRFPDRPNWAARVIHLLPVTGIIMSLTGENNVSFARAWVGVGIVLYLGLAFWLEARVLPVERQLAQGVQGDDVIDLPLAKELARRLDVTALLIMLAVLTMFVQF